jgi:DNA-binding MarR family transcriptional regulator
MRPKTPLPGPQALLAALAEFRFELRQFLLFSENAALAHGLHPQQHQLLLQVAGAQEGEVVTIKYAAERLGLRHNSVVELVDRSEREGLLHRTADSDDRRRMLLRLTAKGERVLRQLADDHARELNELAPRLATALERVGTHVDSAATITRSSR